jgi:hypothetical protein
MDRAASAELTTKVYGHAAVSRLGTPFSDSFAAYDAPAFRPHDGRSPVLRGVRRQQRRTTQLQKSEGGQHARGVRATPGHHQMHDEDEWSQLDRGGHAGEQPAPAARTTAI